MSNSDTPPPGEEPGATDPAFASPRDRARFVRSAGFGGVDVMHARFVDHAFTPHTHDELMIGILHAGVKRFDRERRAHTVGRYGLSINNAGDLHTGERALGEAIHYSALYVPTAVLSAIGLSASFAFTDAVLNDRTVWRHLARAAAADDRLLFEECLTAGLWTAARRYESRAVGPFRDDPPAPIQAAIDTIHAHSDQQIGLGDLAAVSGLSVRHLIRSFERSLGVTPHRYLMSVRVQAARHRLRAGRSLSDTALGCGFADQAHFTKTFRRLMGTTPGQYRRGVFGE